MEEDVLREAVQFLSMGEGWRAADTLCQRAAAQAADFSLPCQHEFLKLDLGRRKTLLATMLVQAGTILLTASRQLTEGS